MRIAAWKARAPRTKVRLHGRLRQEYDWLDVSICDLSNRGLMAEAEQPPGRGHYIEIRRYNQVLVGRVVWQSGRKFGVLLANPIDFQAVIKGCSSPRNTNDRRDHQSRPVACQARIIDKPNDWRWLSQSIERIAVAGMGAMLCAMLAYSVLEFVSTPTSAISAALAP